MECNYVQVEPDSLLGYSKGVKRGKLIVENRVPSNL